MAPSVDTPPNAVNTGETSASPSSMLARWLDDVTKVPVTEKLQGDMMMAMAEVDRLVSKSDQN